MSEQDLSTDRRGRSIRLIGYGDTADEIELDTLDQARAVFGQDCQLQVDRSGGGYRVNSAIETGRGESGGKKWSAAITIFVVE